MPALNFEIEWPDGEVMTCYSPSSIVREYFQAGAKLTISELVETSEAALLRAGQRVEERFGMDCTVAVRQRKKISSRAELFAPDEIVTILSVREQN